MDYQDGNMDVDVPEGAERVEKDLTTQSPVAHNLPDPTITEGELTRPSGPPNKKHKQHNPQFSSIASTVLQRMKQSKEDICSTSLPSDFMPMPPPSQPSQETQEPRSDKACSACTQTSTSLFNPLVQCRRCLGHWHRLCYKPFIPDFMSATSLSFSSQETGSKWACQPCEEAAAASRQQRLQQRTNTKDDHLKIEQPSFLQRAAISKPASSHTKTVSWAHRSVEDRRAHVASLAPRDMAYWLFRAVEQYPDFAMFPEEMAEKAVPAPAPEPEHVPYTATEEIVVARPPQYRNGIINSIRKSQAPAPTAAGKFPRRVVPETTVLPTSEASPKTKPLFEATPNDPDDDPTGLMDGWPRPGRGMYAAVGADWLVETAALADSNDHLSFSSIVYDESGHKVRENGMPLLVYS